MKKTLLLIGVVVSIGLTSCEKCAKCTFVDPEKGKLENEVCDTSHGYEAAVKVYEDNGWECAN